VGSQIPPTNANLYSSKDISVRTGIYLHEHVKPIRILNNGKRAKSFFKYGLTFIATLLLNSEFQSDIDIFNFLSCA